jgi:hypothetical protein
MPLFVTVTPGTTVTSSTTLDAATLNLLGTPSVDITGSVDGGSLTLAAGSVTNASMAVMAATTIKANATTGSNSPTDVPVDSTTMTLDATSLRVKTNGVQYSNIKQVAASRLLGNPTASTANVSEISVGTGLALSTGGVLSSTAPSLSKYTTTAKSLPTDGNATQLVQWLTSASELPAVAYTPQMIRVVLVCQGSVDSPFAAGNEIPIDAVVMQAYISNFPIYSYPVGVSCGVLSGTSLFLNVVFSATSPGNATPYTSAATVGSKMVTLKNTDGTYLTLTRSNWKVKVYLLHDATWS